MNLIVTRPFGAHQRGDVITDADEVAEVLKSEFADHVVAVASEDQE